MTSLFDRSEMKKMSFGIIANPLVEIKDFLKLFATARYLYPRFYSQTGEDMILNQMLGKRKGTYIDIGSGYPIWYSNTYFLYRRGWTGVLVDPIRKNVKYSKFLRRRDTVILGAVSRHQGKAIFHEFKNYAYSTLDASAYESRLASGLELRASYEVETISFKSLVDLIPKNPLTIVFIDTEGHEFNILKSINFNLFRPAIIVVEELVSPLIYSPIRDFLAEKGFVLHAYTGLSSIYRDASFEAY
jgi:FkbM family methyltransferase